MTHTVKGFGTVNRAEVDVSLSLENPRDGGAWWAAAHGVAQSQTRLRQLSSWNPCFFYDPMDVGNLISGSSAFSKSSLNIWKFMVHVLLKPGLENFEHYFAGV